MRTMIMIKSVIPYQNDIVECRIPIEFWKTNPWLSLTPFCPDKVPFWNHLRHKAELEGCHSQNTAHAHDQFLWLSMTLGDFFLFIFHKFPWTSRFFNDSSGNPWNDITFSFFHKWIQPWPYFWFSVIYQTIID